MFVRQNCAGEDSGLLSYLQLYYCSLAKAQPLAFAILVIWIGLLFSTIGIASSDFLCINLSTVASVLGMSESLTGVTFLAFGNGSPDVFSTFAAMNSNSGSLAVGELFGAAGFITAVVAASMALVKPFKVARKSFVRDVVFFIIATIFSMSFLADGRLQLWECAVMVGFYAFYVIFVVLWHWWLGRRRRRRLRETTARLHLHIPQTQELEVEEHLDDEEGRPVHDRAPLLEADNHGRLSALDEAVSPVWIEEDADGDGNDDDDDNQNRYLAALSNNMRVRATSGERRETTNPIRPSLIGALEFRSVLSALEKKGTLTSPISPIELRKYLDKRQLPNIETADNQSTISQPHLGRHRNRFSESDQRTTLRPPTGQAARGRAVSANDAINLKLPTNIVDSLPESAVSSSSAREYLESPLDPSPLVLISPPVSPDDSGAAGQPTPHVAQVGRPKPEGSPSHRPDYYELQHGDGISPSISPGTVTPTTKPRLEIPKLILPQCSSGGTSPSSLFPKYTDSPAALSPEHSQPPNILLAPPIFSPGSAPDAFLGPRICPEDETEPRPLWWWPYSHLPPPNVLMAVLFPTAYGWHDKDWMEKLLGLVTTPSLFLLTVTVPVVESQQEDMLPGPNPSPLTSVNQRQSRIGTQAQLIPGSPTLNAANSPTDEAPPHRHEHSVRQNSDPYPFLSSPPDEPQTDPKEWNRWLIFIQVFTAPLFVVVIVWANMNKNHEKKALLIMILSALVFSLVCLLILLATTSPGRPPRYRAVFCFLGFIVAIAWISTIANEVVGVLKAFGVILGMSDAILGLTIFAVGNSLGDLVADITVARLGYPVMALSACFGGPMLNILLGIGLGGLYMTISHGMHKHKEHPDRPVKYKPYEIEVSTTLLISGITLLVTLVGLLVVVPLNGWKMDRRIGVGLILLWGLSTTAIVIMEVLKYGGDWSSLLGKLG